MAEEVKREEFPGVSPWDVLVWKLDSLEKYIQREIQDLRHETAGLRQELAGLRQELKGEIASLRQEVRDEIRANRRSYTTVELTAILGFIAVIVAIAAARLLP